MDLQTLWETVQSSLGAHTPQLLGALAILIGGWLVAVLARAALMRGLAAIKLNQRFDKTFGLRIDLEYGLGITAFWLVLVLVAMAVFNALNLVMVSGPLSAMVQQVLEYAPRLIGGLVLSVVAWVLATVVRSVTQKLLDKTSLDEKLSSQARMAPISEHLSGALFWIVILLFMPAVLGALGMTGLLEPLNGMVAKVLEYLPNVVAALVVGGVGWIVATVLRHLVGNLSRTAGVDKLSRADGEEGGVRLSSVLGTLVFVLVFVPSLIAALDALKVEAISRPATHMLDTLMQGVPHVVAAGLILVVTWLVAGFASKLLASVLAGVGFDRLPRHIGLAYAFEKTPASTVVGWMALFFAMLFASVEAASQLGFDQVSELVASFIEFGAHILLGSVILMVGFWLANLAYTAIDRAAGPSSTGLAKVARVAILGVVIAMGLRAMGIADDIVNLAFGLTFGAVAVAVALSFGLGGREAAGKLMEHWLSRFRQDK